MSIVSYWAFLFPMAMAQLGRPVSLGVATVRKVVVIWEVEVSPFVNSDAAVIFDVFLKLIVIGPPCVTVVVRAMFGGKFIDCMYGIAIFV